ncbi:uncharacterized protein LOC134246964 [Saccostrea cucullata]|uniref:uncharacterized protein LOC134246964 n=1 Tax=Saccostrea cuccullata TaxID=36930 RepID=UPI002ED0F20B
MRNQDEGHRMMDEGHRMMDPPKEAGIHVPMETDPFLQRNDDHSCEKKREKYRYNSDCIKGWIPLTIIVSIAMAAVMFGIINILKTTYQQHTLQRDKNPNLELQFLEEQGIIVTTKQLYTSDKKINEKPNVNLTTSSLENDNLSNMKTAKESLLEDTRTFKLNMATKASFHPMTVSTSVKADSVSNTYGYTLVSSLIIKSRKNLESGKREFVVSKSPPLSEKGNKTSSTPKQRATLFPRKSSTLTAKSSLLMKKTSTSQSTRLSSIKSSSNSVHSSKISSVENISLTTKSSTTEPPEESSLSSSTSIKSSMTTKRSLTPSTVTFTIHPTSVTIKLPIFSTKWSSSGQISKSIKKQLKKLSNAPSISTSTLLTKKKSTSIRSKSKLSTKPAIKSPSSTNKSSKMTTRISTPKSKLSTKPAIKSSSSTNKSSKMTTKISTPKSLILTKLSLTTKRSSGKPTTISLVRSTTTQAIRPSATVEPPITLTTKSTSTAKFSRKPTTLTSTSKLSTPTIYTSTTLKSSSTSTTHTVTKSSNKITTDEPKTPKSSVALTTRTPPPTTNKSTLTTQGSITSKSPITQSTYYSETPTTRRFYDSLSVHNIGKTSRKTTKLKGISKVKSTTSPQSRISSSSSPQTIKSTNSVSQSSLLKTQGTLNNPQLSKEYTVTQNALSTRTSSEVTQTSSGSSKTFVKSQPHTIQTTESGSGSSSSTPSHISILTQTRENEKQSIRSQGMADTTILGNEIPPMSTTYDLYTITSTPRLPSTYRSSPLYTLYSKSRKFSSDHSIIPVTTIEIKRNEDSESESTYKVIPANRQTPQPTDGSNVQDPLARKKTTSKRVLDSTSTRKETSTNSSTSTRKNQLTTTEPIIAQQEKTKSPMKNSNDNRNQWKVPLKCPRTDLNPEKMEFYKIGVEATSGLAELDEDTRGWSVEEEDTSENITIHSKYIYKWGLKIYRRC